MRGSLLPVLGGRGRHALTVLLLAAACCCLLQCPDAAAQGSNVAMRKPAYGSWKLFSDEEAAQYCVDGQRSGWSDCYLYRSGGGSPWFVTINLQQPYEISEIRVYAKEIYLNWMTQFQLVVSESALSDPELVAHAVAYSHAGGSGGAPVIPGAVPDEDRIVVVGSSFLRQTRGQFVTLMLVNSDSATPEVQEIEVYGEPRPEEGATVSALISSAVYFFELNECQSALATGTVLSSARRPGRVGLRAETEVGLRFGAAGRGAPSGGQEQPGALSYAVAFSAIEKAKHETDRYKLGLHLPSPIGLPSGRASFSFACWLFLSPVPAKSPWGWGGAYRDDYIYQYGQRIDGSSPSDVTLNSLGLTPYSDKVLQARWSDWSDSSDSSSAAAALTEGEWQHVALVYSTGDVRRFFVNGVEYRGSTATLADVQPVGPLTFGESKGYSVGVYNGLTGSMAEVGFWDRELLASEVQALYQRPAPIAPLSCEPSGSAGLKSAGVIVGIAVGAVAAVTLITVAGMVYLGRRRRARSAAAAGAPAAAPTNKRGVEVISVARRPAHQPAVALQRVAPAPSAPAAAYVPSANGAQPPAWAGQPPSAAAALPSVPAVPGGMAFGGEGALVQPPPGRAWVPPEQFPMEGQQYQQQPAYQQPPAFQPQDMLWPAQPLPYAQLAYSPQLQWSPPPTYPLAELQQPPQLQPQPQHFVYAQPPPPQPLMGEPGSGGAGWSAPTAEGSPPE